MESEGWLKTKHYINITFQQENVSLHIDESSGCCWVSKYNTFPDHEVCPITYVCILGYFNFVY